MPGGSYFFTVVTERRALILGTDLARDLLRAAFRDCFDRWPPFRVDAMVMRRDHLHAIWTHSITHIFFALLSTTYERSVMALIYTLKINSLSVVIARTLKQFWLYGREKCFEKVASP